MNRRPRTAPIRFAALLSIAGLSLPACIETKRYFVTGTGGPDCGDQIVQANEACDGALPPGQTACAREDAERFVGGALTCKACSLDTSACVEGSDSSVLSALRFVGVQITDLASIKVAPTGLQKGASGAPPAIEDRAGLRGDAAVRFDDKDEGIGWLDNSSITTTSPTTIAGWFRVREAPTGSAELFSDRLRTASVFTAGTELFVAVLWRTSGGQQTMNVGLGLPVGSYFYLAASLDAVTRAASVTLIAPDERVFTERATLPSLASGAGGKVIFGASGDGNGFAGFIDSPRLWKLPLSAGDVCASATGEWLEAARVCRLGL